MEKFLIGTLLLLMSGTAQAANGETTTYEGDVDDRSRNDRTFYLGGLVGGSDLGSGNSDTNYGLTLGGKWGDVVGLGFYGTYARTTGTADNFGLPTGTNVRAFRLLGEFNVFLAWLHVGVDIGAAINTWAQVPGDVNASTSETQMIVGPQAGIDIPIAGPLSIGAEAHYLVSTAEFEDNELQAMAALKLWL